jgi:hypothetical protein
MIPTPLSVLLVAAAVGLTGLVVAGIAYAAQAQRGSTPGAGTARIVGIATAILVGWVGMVIVLASKGAFAANPDTSVPVIAFAIIIPIILGAWLLAASGRFRTLVEAIPLHWLIGVQFYRVLGVAFLLAYFERHMPGTFAVPAGVGDILVGLAAPLAAYAVVKNVRSARLVARGWNILGIADLVLAVSLGFLTSPSTFQQLALAMPNLAITRYPFVLIPAFAVPVSILLHIFSLWRLRSTVSPALSVAPRHGSADRPLDMHHARG